MKKLIISLSSIVLLLVVSEIICACQLVVAGKSMGQVDYEIANLEQTNILLSEQVASASSLITIRQKATELGFQSTKTVVTMRKDQFSVAMNAAK